MAEDSDDIASNNNQDIVSMDSEAEDQPMMPQHYVLDRDMEAHLLSVCQAVGGYELKTTSETSGKDNPQPHDQKQMKETYVLGDEGLECLRDIKRFLRYDDRTEGKCILRTLGKWRFLLTDLLPILTQYTDSTRIAEATIELMVPLTWPVDIKDPVYAEQVRYMQSYKAAMSEGPVLQALLKFFVKLLAKPARERSEREVDNIRLTLSLLRNLLSIPDPLVAGDVPAHLMAKSKLQEKLIKALRANRLMDLFISFASSMDESDNSDWNLMVLEIFYLLFQPYDPISLLKESEKQAKNSMLSEVLAQQKENITSFKTSRHPRFGGSLMVQTGGTSQRILTSSKPLCQQINDMYDENKKEFKYKDRKTKETKDMIGCFKDIDDDKTRVALKECAEMFLESAFNVLMASVKRDLAAERAKVTDEDYQRYLSLVSFFLKFQQAKAGGLKEGLENHFEVVAASLDRSSMIFVLRQIDKCYVEKLPIPLHVSVNSFKQIMHLVQTMWESEVEEHNEVARTMLGHLFCERGHLDMLKLMVKNPLITSRNFLEDLIEMNHILFRLLDRFIKDRHGILFTRKKSKNRKEGGDNDDEGEVQASYSYSESKLEFKEFEMGYANEPTVNTYFALLKEYNSLKPETISFITKMYHRIFVKCDMQALFYRIDILDLFNDILTARNILHRRTPFFKELTGFIRFVVSRFVKKVAEYPLIYVELLYPKTRKSDLYRIQSDLQDDDDDLFTGLSAPRLVEVEVNSRLTWKEQIGVLVNVMLKDEHRPVLEWLAKSLSDFAYAKDNDNDANGEGALELNLDNENAKEQIKVNGHFVALLKLCHFQEEKPEEPVDQTEGEQAPSTDTESRWKLPLTILSGDLRHAAETITELMDKPIEFDKPLTKLIKKKKTRKVRSDYNDDDPDAEPRKKKSRKEKEEEAGKYLSTKFVEDSSDEDEELIEDYRRRMEEQRIGIANDDVPEMVIQTVTKRVEHQVVAKKPAKQVKPTKSRAQESDGEESESEAQTSSSEESEAQATSGEDSDGEQSDVEVAQQVPSAGTLKGQSMASQKEQSASSSPQDSPAAVSQTAKKRKRLVALSDSDDE